MECWYPCSREIELEVKPLWCEPVSKHLEFYWIIVEQPYRVTMKIINTSHMEFSLNSYRLYYCYTWKTFLDNRFKFIVWPTVYMDHETPSRTHLIPQDLGALYRVEKCTFSSIIWHLEFRCVADYKQLLLDCITANACMIKISCNTNRSNFIQRFVLIRLFCSC